MILVTGGAGYIGSQTLLQLQDAGKKVVVLDNLSTGNAHVVKDCPLIEGSVGDKALVANIFQEYDIDSVMHFAAHTIVPESIQNPLKYYQNNLCETVSLIESCVQHQVKNFIFSSTAAVYGLLDHEVVREEDAGATINPYGTSKWFAERVLLDACRSSTMKSVILRYFNVAGADPEGRVGPTKVDTTILTRVVIQVGLKHREKLMVYGNDYPTKDGTGVRDYIHVADIAAAHIDALTYLKEGGETDIFNCGYGHGYSVKEIIEAAEKICDLSIPFEVEPRRLGDPAAVIAANQKILGKLNWQPKYDDLTKILVDAYRWEKQLLMQGKA